MLYDGDISGDDDYTLETLQAAAVEILGSPSGKDEDFNRGGAGLVGQTAGVRQDRPQDRLQEG
jgi:hypothetical protein